LVGCRDMRRARATDLSARVFPSIEVPEGLVFAERAPAQRSDDNRQGHRERHPCHQDGQHHADDGARSGRRRGGRKPAYGCRSGDRSATSVPLGTGLDDRGAHPSRPACPGRGHHVPQHQLPRPASRMVSAAVGQIRAGRTGEVGVPQARVAKAPRPCHGGDHGSQVSFV
jgi:hypothetical protein